jgi:hypothetical protein
LNRRRQEASARQQNQETGRFKGELNRISLPMSAPVMKREADDSLPKVLFLASAAASWWVTAVSRFRRFAAGWKIIKSKGKETRLVFNAQLEATARDFIIERK